VSKRIFRTAVLLLAGASASLASDNIQCPLGQKAITELRGGLEWYAFWIYPKLAIEYTPGVKAHAELVISSDATVVYLEAPKLECWFSNATGRLRRVGRYGPKSAKVEATEYLAVLRGSRASRSNCIPVVSPEQRGPAKAEGPSGNVLPIGRLCPPGEASAEPRQESCELVLPALRVSTYPNAPLDSAARQGLVDAVREAVRHQWFSGDRVTVTIPMADFGDPQVFIFVEAKNYPTRGLLQMLPIPDGGWEADNLIVDIPKNNIGALIEKVKENQVLRLVMP
jgi:hypothetical protein